jgi:hypothetical protein
VGPAIVPQDGVVEMFDAEAEPRDAQLAQCVHLRLAERAGLALEGHFLGLVPMDIGFQAIDQPPELLLAKK